MNAPTLKVVESIVRDIMDLVQTIMNANDLRESALNKDTQLKIREQGNPVIDIIFNDYLSYLETGRRARSGKMPRISDLRDWALKKGIPTDNSALFLIARSIWQKGLTARPILAVLEEEIEKSFMHQWADSLFEALVGELKSYLYE
ncbi:hypothetical protein [Viscerimonas tarda]